MLRRNHPTFLLLAMSAVVLATPASGSDFDLADLSALLNRTDASTVSYIEHQYRKVLTAPIEQQGELHFTPPNRFEKQVLQPTRESYLLAGETLTITQSGHKPRQLSVRNQPLLRGLLLSFQAVVSGRLADLQPVYQTELGGSPANWQLTLKPSDTQLKHYVSQIVITGHQGEPQKFEVMETSGDRVVTEIRPAARL